MPLPGTNKNNSLAFISILFLEVFTAAPKGGYGGALALVDRPRGGILPTLCIGRCAKVGYETARRPNSSRLLRRRHPLAQEGRGSDGLSARKRGSVAMPGTLMEFANSRSNASIHHVPRGHQFLTGFVIQAQAGPLRGRLRSRAAA
jgi:hypothetical protein